MQIREANKVDIPEIVEVLKASLGETDLPLSQEIWNYKHILNPFGESIVWIAEEDNKIIGVRALMRWEWKKNNETFTALRAVDTATHPDHQGKGIFKKLTLQAVNIAKEEGANFIFNTPNEKSRPGYLKMGWKPAGKIKVALQPAFSSFWKFNNEPVNYQVNYETSLEKIENLCIEWNMKMGIKKLYTPKSLSYLRWRYEKNPLQQYEAFATSDFYLAGYIKIRNNIKELRVAECIFINNNCTNIIQKKLNEWSKKFGVQIISFSPDLLLLNYPNFKGKFGPLLTLRELNLSNSQKESCLNLDSWVYSLGDLELF